MRQFFLKLQIITFAFFAISTFAVPPEPELGERWVRNDQYSDEFDGNNLDDTKWNKTFKGWKGRQPAYFNPNTISVSGGNMIIRNKPDVPSDAPNGYSISGGAVQSKNETSSFGYYECNFRASRVNMSTTFWLSSSGRAEARTADGNDTYSQELDICESIGGAGNFSSDFRKKMKFNTHYRLRKDPWPTPETFYSRGNNQVEIRDGDLQGGDASLRGGTESWEDFHTYGCHWRSAQDATFFVDNDFIGVVKFRTDVVSDPFKDPMKINLVTETYNWAKPYPTTAQLNDNSINASYYNWVRTYVKLPVDQVSSLDDEGALIYTESVAFRDFDATQEGTLYNFVGLYQANVDRDIHVIIKNASGVIVQDTKYSALAGYGKKAYGVNVSNALPEGNYTVTVELRPSNGGANSVISKETKNLTVGQANSDTGGDNNSNCKTFEEVNGILAVEAEDFTSQTKTSDREWFMIMPNTTGTPTPDPDGNHASTASGDAYLELLPDTRVTHGDPLVNGVSFSNTPGQAAVLNYKVYFNSPGKYFVWVRAHSTGSEDNGLHVGLDGEWPASGARMQWCEGKNAWTWASKQRTDANHCGVAQQIFLDVTTAGEHTINFSMREDGFEFDKFVLSKVYTAPSGNGPNPKKVGNCGTGDSNVDLCPNDPNKEVPGLCGCGKPETPECGNSNVVRPLFNKYKDILIAQFDSKPDPDDIHAQAALGCMLSHKDLEGVNYYGVAGAYGIQNGNFIDSDDLFDLAFGTGNWTDADADRSGSVTRIVDKVIPILQNGGQIWVQEAGQSNITADWIKEVQKTVDNSIVKNNVIVVQHSPWNQDQTASADLAFVRNNTNYFYIDNGNASFTADWGDYGPWQTPEYRSRDAKWIDAAENSPNPRAKALWLEAAKVIDREYPNGIPYDWSFMKNDGLDYSDCVENWWIFSIGDKANSVEKFWDRYVTNTTDIIDPDPKDCAGVAGGTAQLSCGVCWGGTTGVSRPDNDNDGIVNCDDSCPDDATNTCNDNGSTVIQLSPIHDAYLQGTGGTLFNNNLLRVESGNRISYFIFDLSNVNGTITNASLNLTVAGDPGNGTLNVNLGSSTSWTETNLSNANQPSSGTLLGSINGPYADEESYSISLSELTAGGKIALTLSQVDGNDVSFSSKEGANVPTLSLTIDENSPTEDILGLDCISKGGSADYELNATLRNGAISYSWWYTGSESVNQDASFSYRAYLDVSGSVSSGQICVGVNYGSAPQYAEYCKNVMACSDVVNVEDDISNSKAVITVFPNPSSDVITLTNVEPSEIKSIIDVNGVEVQVKPIFTSAGVQIDISSFSEGVYMILAGNEMIRFVKN